MWNNAGQPKGWATVLDGTPAVSSFFVGSVSGHLHVPEGVTVDIWGVLEDAVVSGPGTVRVSGLIAGVFARDGCTLLGRLGSVVVPEEADGPWLVLRTDGTWAESAHLVFPVPSGPAGDAASWRPIPRC